MFVSTLARPARVLQPTFSTPAAYILIGFTSLLPLLLAKPAAAQLAPLTLPWIPLTETTISNLEPKLAGSPSGHVVVLTLSPQPSRSPEARFLAPDGGLLAVRTLDNEFIYGFAAAAAPEERFLITWTRRQSPDQEVFGQWFTHAGAPLGARFVLGGSSSEALFGAPAATCNDSGCVVAWSLLDGGIRWRRLPPGGLPSEASQLLPRGGQSDLSLALRDDNAMALAWVDTHLVFVTDGFSVFLINEPLPVVQVLLPDGTPASGPFPLSREEPQFKRQISRTSHVAAAWNEQGELVVLWDRSIEGPPHFLFSRTLNSGGAPLADEVEIDQGTGIERADLAWSPTLGGFVASWLKSPGHIRTQVLTSEGQPRGVPVEASTRPEAEIAWNSQALAGDNRLWLGWQSLLQGDGWRLALQPWLIGEPTCSRPFEIPNDSIPCAEVLSGRFKVFASFRRQDGTPAEAPAEAKTDRAAFVFFNSIFNPELAVKMLDGRPVNGNFWLFFGAMSNQEYVLSAYDTETDATRVYYNPPGRLASVGDTAAFPGGSSAVAASEDLEETAAWQGIELVPEQVVGRATSGTCVASSTLMCLQGERFSVAVDWRVSSTQSGQGQMQTLTDQGGYVTFFNPANMELALKVLDGRPVNGRFWVFYASMTNVEFTLRVTDHETGQVWQRRNPPRTMASVADTDAL